MQEKIINEIRGTVEKLDASQLEAEKQAFDVINSSDTSLNLVKEGITSIESIISKIDELNKIVAVSSENIKQLEQLSKMIENFAGVIAGIANKTNMLSLNASIEAARAGEQGRGFAVVASQIQKLAEQSNNSALAIHSIIESLLKDSASVVETMEEVKVIMEEQSDKVRETADIFTVVKRGVDDSIASIGEISMKNQGIDQARVSVVDVVQELTAIAEENAAGTEETSAYTSQVNTVIEDIAQKTTILNEIVKKLEEQINQFQL